MNAGEKEASGEVSRVQLDEAGARQKVSFVMENLDELPQRFKNIRTISKN